MPELPEVETICRGIRPHILDKKFCDFWHSGKQLRWPIPILAIRQHLLGQRVSTVTRRAKYLLVYFDNKALLAFHFGMTGNLGIFSKKYPRATHCHLAFTLDDKKELRYTDTRRFGAIKVLGEKEVPHIEETLFGKTGPEPFSQAFNADYLFKIAQTRKLAIKPFIMDTQVVAGVGNIYANEALFSSGIAPYREVNTLHREQWKTLIRKIRETLDQAIVCGGATISDYLNAAQGPGYFQMHFKVYGKAGEACQDCGTILEKIQIRGRASYFCRKCQK